MTTQDSNGQSGVLPALPESNTPVTASQLMAIERDLAVRVGQVEDVKELGDWLDKAKALEAYLRSRELQRPMLGAQRRIEARIGQLLGKPRPGRPNPHHDEVSHDQHRADFRLLARALDGDVELVEEEWRKSRRALVSVLRQRLGLTPETPALPEGQFRCIVADPPWKLDTGPEVWNGTGERGHDALAYEQMSLDEIAALDVESCAADDAHLYLWTTNRYVESAYGIARAWGFKPSALLVWCKKPRGIGLGDTFRQTAEYVLFARRGSLPGNQIVERTWFEWPRGRHSAKPEAFYELVESVTPGPHLDMFARRERRGWTVWGDEVDALAA